VLHAHHVAFVLMAMTLAVSGCGGSKPANQAASTSRIASSTQTTRQTASSTATALLTRAELIARADAICQRVNAKRALITIRTRQDYARLLPLATYEQAALVELGKLTAPTSMASDWRQILADGQTLADDTAKLGEDVKANYLTTARRLFAITVQVQRQMLATARRDGFRDCARAS
jgi:hypothetical protein